MNQLSLTNGKSSTKRILYKGLLCLLIAFAFVQFGQIVTVQHAYAASHMPDYSCGGKSDINAQRCYATYHWTGGTTGGQTSIDIWQTSCTGSCSSNGFINQDFWLQQDGNSSCQINICWVEAGYINTTGSVMSYFWADNRPNGGGYNFHWNNVVSSNDIKYGVLHEQIYQLGDVYELDRSIYFCTSCTSFNVQFSASNNMAANDIVVGTELAGFGSGASSPGTHFKSNYWRDGSGNWHPQNHAESYNEVVSSPPYGYWNIVPSGSSSGDWYTYCC